MLRRISLSLLLPLAAAAAMAADLHPKFRPAAAGGVAGEYVVVLEEGVARGPGQADAALPSVREVARRLVARYGGSVGMSYEHALAGFEARLPESAARRLALDPRVRFVEQNHAIEIDSIASCYSEFANVAIEAGSPNLLTMIDSPQPIACEDPDPIRRPGDPPAAPGDPDPAHYLSCTDNWGLDLIDGARDGSYDFSATGHGVHVYVIDLGVNADHLEFDDLTTPGFDSRVRGGFNAGAAANGEVDPAILSDIRDCAGNSHGTHVAAIIGGNTFGVAKQAILHPVKFGDLCPGQSYNTTAATARAAMEWILAHHNQDEDLQGPGVVNWSGGNTGQSGYRDEATALAVRSLIDAGLTFVQSAGNQDDMVVDGAAQDACVRSLGNYGMLDGGLIVVGGVDETVVGGQRVYGRWRREIGPLRGPSYTFCRSDPESPQADDILDCGSNSGSCVDLWAPAGHIVSATREGTDTACRLSGTSMAAPHVTGVVALYLDSQCPDATTASCVVPPASVKSALVQGATCGALEDDPASPYFIGAGSPNRLLNSLLGGSCLTGNAPPVPVADSLSTPFGTSISFLASTLLANDGDPDGDAIFFYGIGRQPSHGDLGIDGIGPEDTVYRYTPHGGFIGTDSFEYLVQDSRGATAPGTVTITVTSQGFGGNPDFFTTPADTPLRVLSTDLTSNDSPGVAFIRAENPRNGTLVLGGIGPEASVYDFTPSAGFLGEAGFDYLISPNGAEPYTQVVVTVQVSDDPPSPAFDATCSGLACSFDASPSTDDVGIAGYAWTFGDGASAAGAAAAHTYGGSASFLATLTVTDSRGQEAQTSQVITVDALPVASFTVSCSGLTCSFDGSGSTDAGGGITSYAWTFGDGATGSGVTATRTYATSGERIATLTVTDTSGQTASTSRTVTIDFPPTACFTASCSGLICSVNAGCSTDDLGISSYAWNFGDGATGSGVTAARTYATSGARTVTLTVTDGGGHTSTTTRTVNPDSPPLAAFTWSCTQRTCSFNGTGSTDNQPIAAYAWTFGDGSSGSGPTPTHTYAAGGGFTVTLTVTDSVGQKDPETKTIAVNRPPVAVADSGATVRDTAVNLNVLANDSDPDGNPLTARRTPATTAGVPTRTGRPTSPTRISWSTTTTRTATLSPSPASTPPA